ncbi:MAG: flagellar biosynthesis protein FlhA [Ahrensia sp.]|nr:flagellar biosynthesis protein FlhA [Ahrensia sp.]
MKNGHLGDGLVPSGRGRDVIFACGIVFILAILFLPIPTFLIDIGLTLSIALSVLILMVSLWIARPLDFSSFPTILLVATMLRLSLNIATTRTILADGHEGVNAAGYVIGGFSRFVMGGDFVIGLTVFLILIVVNFVVITKGSTRIAEVGARFTLDAIPGKQMSIDADLSAGIIDDREAQARRRELEEESSFFGSMDGASKFVRGDAVAGLIITAINIIGGIVIGTTRHNMELVEAVDVFTKLSVGDGLVSQIPALVVSLAAGLLVSKGGTRGSADQAVFNQMGAYPKALQIAAALLVVLGLMPGLPFMPFAIWAGVCVAVARAETSRRAKEEAAQAQGTEEEEPDIDEERRNAVRSSLDTAEIELVYGQHLARHLAKKQDEIAHRMTRMRQKFARTYGFVVPEVHITEDLDIDPKSYAIKIHGTSVASHELRPDDLLVLVGDGDPPDLPGEPTTEPAFGISAIYTSNAFRDELLQTGFKVADNVSVLLTHLSEVIRTNLPQLLSYKDTKTLVAGLDPDYQKLADELCTTHLSYPALQAILRLLLSERVSIRNLNLILESIAEIAPQVRRTETLVEHVRMRMAQQMCGDIAVKGVLHVLRLGERWDKVFHDSVTRDASGDVVGFDMEPKQLEEFGKDAAVKLDEQIKKGRNFAVVTTPDARTTVRMVMERLHPNVPVLSHVEIARGIDVQVIGSIS